jgi:hypothetical protein
LLKIFKYFDELFVEMKQHQKHYFETEYEIIKINALPQYKDEMSEEDLLFWENVESNYFNDIDDKTKKREKTIDLMFETIENNLNKYIKELHKETSYCKYMITEFFHEYLNNIEGFTYIPEIENAIKDNTIDSFIDDQKNLLKRGE